MYVHWRNVVTRKQFLNSFVWQINCSLGLIFLLYVPMVWIPAGALLTQFVLVIIVIEGVANH